MTFQQIYDKVRQMINGFHSSSEDKFSKKQIQEMVDGVRGLILMKHTNNGVKIPAECLQTINLLPKPLGTFESGFWVPSTDYPKNSYNPRTIHDYLWVAEVPSIITFNQNRGFGAVTNPLHLSRLAVDDLDQMAAVPRLRWHKYKENAFYAEGKLIIRVPCQTAHSFRVVDDSEIARPYSENGTTFNWLDPTDSTLKPMSKMHVMLRSVFDSPFEALALNNEYSTQDLGYELQTTEYPIPRSWEDLMFDTLKIELGIGKTTAPETHDDQGSEMVRPQEVQKQSRG